MRWLRHPWVHRILGFALGAVFLYAAHDKIADPRPLVTIIWGYRLIPPGPANLMVIYMPWLELLVGLGLLTGFKRRAAALWATGLLSAFVVALMINAIRGINVACGCFSTSSQDVENGWVLVLRDLPMLLVAAWMLFLPPRRARTSHRSS
jgi:putative oxidoreductase